MGIVRVPSGMIVSTRRPSIPISRADAETKARSCSSDSILSGDPLAIFICLPQPLALLPPALPCETKLHYAHFLRPPRNPLPQACACPQQLLAHLACLAVAGAWPSCLRSA